MKNIKLILLIALSFSIYTSCDKSELDVKPSTPTEAAYFLSENEFERAAIGVYAKLTDFYWYSGGAGNTLSTVFSLPGDDITTTGVEEFEGFANLQPGSGRLNNLYATSYQLINRAIVLLDKNAAVADGIYKTPNLKNYHRGEALFLRGYGYYLLWNYFGTAPLVTTRALTPADVTPPSSKGTELLDQAIADFTEAVTLLPVSWPATDRGRATTNAANGLLGKSLLFKANFTKSTGDYQTALSTLNKVIGLSLTTKFDDNFAVDTENNVESLFEFQASQPTGGDNIWLPNDFDNAIGSISAYWGFYGDGSFAQFGKPIYTVTQKLANLYEVGDPRASLTYQTGSLKVMKYVTRDQKSQSGVSSVNNPRILRFADVLLLKAEAINESAGATTQAIDLINQIRTRARGTGAVPANRPTTETDRVKIRQWIMDERLLELAGEGQRWFDVRRWSLAGFITLNNTYFSPADPANMNFTGKNINFPIPSDEILKNINVTQNTGY